MGFLRLPLVVADFGCFVTVLRDRNDCSVAGQAGVVSGGSGGRGRHHGGG